jgi:NAD(P)H-dependent FMN reductase
MSKIQIITGSTRPGRVSIHVANWVKDIASLRDDIEVELVDIADYNLPLLDEPIPASAGQYQHEHTKKFASKIAEADGFIFVTAEHNHTIPASLKNALDYLYAEWNNKAGAIVNYGYSASGARAAEQLRLILAELQIATVRNQTSLFLPESFGDGQMTPTDKNENDLNAMLDQLVLWGEAMNGVRAKQS